MRAGIVDDLGKAVDGIFEAVVEAVDEDQHAAVRAFPDSCAQPLLRLFPASGLSPFKVAKSVAGIGWQFLRPGDLADLAACRRDRDRDVRECRSQSSLAREHLAGLAERAARRGDQHVHPAGGGEVSATGTSTFFGRDAHPPTAGQATPTPTKIVSLIRPPLFFFFFFFFFFPSDAQDNKAFRWRCFPSANALTRRDGYELACN